MALVDGQTAPVEILDDDIVQAKNGNHVRVLVRSRYQFKDTSGVIHRGKSSTRLCPGTLNANLSDAVSAAEHFG